MSKTKWHTRAIYLIVALVMTLGLLLVPAVPAQAELAYPPVEVEPVEGAVTPSLAVNVKGAAENFTASDVPVQWDILPGMELTAADIEIV